MEKQIPKKVAAAKAKGAKVVGIEALRLKDERSTGEQAEDEGKGEQAEDKSQNPDVQNKEEKDMAKRNKVLAKHLLK